MSKFKCNYCVDDGYTGNIFRPQSFCIDKDVIDEFMSEEGLKDLFEEEMQIAFEKTVIPRVRNVNEFVEWAKEVQNERKSS